MVRIGASTTGKPLSGVLPAQPGIDYDDICTTWWLDAQLLALDIEEVDSRIERGTQWFLDARPDHPRYADAEDRLTGLHWQRNQLAGDLWRVRDVPARRTVGEWVVRLRRMVAS